MKLGLKIFYKKDYETIKPLFDKIDFLEVMALEGEDYSFLKNWKKPIVVHCMHTGLGINFANPLNFSKNRSALRFAIKLADEFNAKYIIVHAGEKESGFCAEVNIGHFLQKYDSRVLIENSIYKQKFERYYFDYNGIKRVMEAADKKLCLDFEHAAKSAVQIDAGIIKFVKDLIGLNPVYFHICDGDGKEKEHLYLGEGNLPLKEFKELIPKDAWVLIETGHDIKKQEKDIAFMRS
ncbi:MAG: sugar phosphate isomerase/epimerase [Nanoarchaeota archaeon]|nr:sugar phosphate isomerase/epimerase [Nanoarchaeota archaeon]